jgi:hypothetical protein
MPGRSNQTNFQPNIQEIMKNENLDEQIEIIHKSILQDSLEHEKTSDRKEIECQGYKVATEAAVSYICPAYPCCLSIA